MIGRKSSKILTVGGVPRVSLLPPAEVDLRSRKELRMTWLATNIVAVSVITLGSLVGLGWMVQAQAVQASAEQDSVTLQAEAANYSELIQVQTEVQGLQKARAQAGSNDIAWGSLINEIKAVLPAGVTLTGFRLAPGAAPKSGAAASGQVGLTGTLTFSAPNTAMQAQTVTRLRTVSGFLAVDAGALSASNDGGAYTFAVTFTADQTRYTGRFGKVGG
jgi:Tfp pilus assembly protein PilN